LQQANVLPAVNINAYPLESICPTSIYGLDGVPDKNQITEDGKSRQGPFSMFSTSLELFGDQHHWSPQVVPFVDTPGSDHQTDSSLTQVSDYQSSQTISFCPTISVTVTEHLMHSLPYFKGNVHPDDSMVSTKALSGTLHRPCRFSCDTTTQSFTKSMLTIEKQAGMPSNSNKSFSKNACLVYSEKQYSFTCGFPRRTMCLVKVKTETSPGHYVTRLKPYRTR